MNSGVKLFQEKWTSELKIPKQLTFSHLMKAQKYLQQKYSSSNLHIQNFQLPRHCFPFRCEISNEYLPQCTYIRKTNSCTTFIAGIFIGIKSLASQPNTGTYRLFYMSPYESAIVLGPWTPKSHLSPARACQMS